MISYPNPHPRFGERTNMNSKKFVPDAFTEEIISKLAQEETGKRQYYRPVYSLHKWWARRPGAQFRSIILLAKNLADRLFMSSPDGTLSERSDYFQSHDLRDTVILDPFMGGGTTLAEANRLGARVIGCDINPVSFWIVRETLKPIDLEKLEGYFQQLERGVGEKIKSLYRTNCVYCSRSQGEGLYAFWLRYVNCPHCGEVVPLFKRTLLNKGLSRNKSLGRTNPATVFCPRCYALNEWHGEGSCICKECSFAFDPQASSYNQGYYACPRCGKDRISLIQTLKPGQRLQEKLVAIEYWCQRCKARLYKSPDANDLAKIECIEATFRDLKEHLVFPRQRILEGSSSIRWRQHNYYHYYQVFNARQLLAFDYLIEAILAIPEEEYRNAFITVFSNSLEYNNMMTPYNYPHRKLHHLFNYHAMPLTTTPVENAVWGFSNEGAGTFVNCYRRYILAKQYCQRPFDKFKGSHSSIKTVYAETETVAANFVSSFDELKQTRRGALLLCGDSSRLPVIPDKCVDFVITDPPYFDNIHYSELSNFFYVWLTQFLEHPYFGADSVPTEQEAIVNEGMGKGEEGYRRLLASVFRECARVLKDEGQLIFTFHHSKWQAWWTILSAVTEGGFHVTNSFPVASEYKVNPHIREKQTLDMDLVLVCQKNCTPFKPLSLSLGELVQHAINSLPIEGSNSDKNRLFLYFVGELLKAASVAWQVTDVTYEWFAGVLSHFEDLAAGRLVNAVREESGRSDSAQLELI
jgi:putative DNA methylase